MKKITCTKIQTFKEYLIAEEKSKATIDKYIHDITAFTIWLKNDILCKEKILEYKEYLIGKYSPRSVNSILSSLNSFFAYNGEFSLHTKTLKIQRQIFLDKKKELTKCDYKKLLLAAKSKNKIQLYYLIQTIASTGLRVSEVRYITVDAVKFGQTTINCKGKIRQLFLPKMLCKLLKAYIKSQNIKSGSVFVTKNGKPLDRSNIWKILKHLCDIAGVSKEKVFPHNLRRLFARTFYSLEKDIVRLADILGHSSVNTTRIYTMETGEICRRQIQRMGLLRC